MFWLQAVRTSVPIQLRTRAVNSSTSLLLSLERETGSNKTRVSTSLTSRRSTTNSSRTTVSCLLRFHAHSFPTFHLVSRCWYKKLFKLRTCFVGGQLDTQRSMFREAGGYRTYYLRIVRVSYTTAAGSGVTSRPVLTYRTFSPVQLSHAGMTSVGHFETTSETMKRALSWIAATGKNFEFTQSFVCV